MSTEKLYRELLEQRERRIRKVEQALREVRGMTGDPAIIDTIDAALTEKQTISMPMAYAGAAGGKDADSA